MQSPDGIREGQRGRSRHRGPHVLRLSRWMRPSQELHGGRANDRIPVEMNKLYKVLVIPDCQVPYEDKLSMRAVEKYMGDESWDEIVYIGDFMDFHQLAKFTKDEPEALTKTLAGDYKAANEILDRHESLTKRLTLAGYKEPKRVFILGNHEDR